jgi:hypothetical protein
MASGIGWQAASFYPVGADNSVVAADLVSCAWSGTGEFGIRLRESRAVRHFQSS